MATKIFCDGCDADITGDRSDSRKGLRIEASTDGGNVKMGQFAGGPFDLCKACIDRYKRECDPRTWPRFKSEGPRCE
jgi:hypothetical protein